MGQNQQIIRKYWVSSKIMTIQVNVDQNNVIVFIAPVARRFIGQPIMNLVGWLRKSGAAAIKPLE